MGNWLGICLLVLALMVSGCAGNGERDPDAGVMAGEWHKIREACGLSGSEETAVMDLNFTLDSSTGKPATLQIEFTAGEGQDAPAYTVRLDQTDGSYQVLQSASGLAISPLIIDDAQVPVDAVFTAIDRMDSELLAPVDGDQWLYSLHVVTDEGRVYKAGEKNGVFSGSFDEIYHTEGEHTIRLGNGEAVAVSGVNVLLQGRVMENGQDTGQDTVRSRQFILDLAGKADPVTFSPPSLAEGEQMLEVRYADLSGEGEPVPLYLVGKPSEADSEFPDQRRLIIQDDAGTRDITLPDSCGFHGTDFRVRDLNADGRPELMFFDFAGGSGGVIELNVFRLDGETLMPVFTSPGDSVMREMYNEYLGDNRVRIAAPLLNRAWEYQLEPPVYGTPNIEIEENEVYEGFSREWVDPFSGYTLEARADGSVAITGRRVVCGMAHVDVVGVLHHTLEYQDHGYVSKALELYRHNGSVYERVEPISLEAKERRLITRDTDLIFPSAIPQTLRTLDEGAFVDVLDEHPEDSLLFVRMNVYDTPLDYHGWVKAQDTAVLTAENADSSREVHIRDGAKIYEVSEFERINDTIPQVWQLGHSVVRIVEERDGMVRLDAAGGASFWTEAESIIYPEPL